MLDGSRVVVVVPAFREALHVARVIDTMPAFVDHVVVVDDGSDDGTSEVAREAARARGDARVVVLRHDVRRGVGAAIATGYREGVRLTSSPTDALCVMAGDGQMHPDDLSGVAGPVARDEADYVKGDRFRDPGVRGSMGLPRWIGGQAFSRLTSLAIGQRISDSQCGFTALSRRAAMVLGFDRGAPGAHARFDRLWPGFGYPNDLLGLLAARGLRIREVFVRPVYGRETSKLRLRHLPPIFFLIARAAMRRRVARSDDPGAGKGELRRRGRVSS